MLRPMVLTGEHVLESIKAMEALSAGRKLPRPAFLKAYSSELTRRSGLTGSSPDPVAM
jgi:hypothetical protein